MPSYSFVDTETDKRWTEYLTISAMEQMLKENPNIKIDFANVKPVGLSYNDLPHKKPPQDFRDILSSIKKGNKGSNINTW